MSMYGNRASAWQQSLEAALGIVAYGWPCFPCGASKAPLCPGGHTAATSDKDAVLALWSAAPKAELVGVPTGNASGVSVLDLDIPRHPAASVWLEQNRNRLPPTFVVETRSGGQHWFFQHRPGLRNSAGAIHEGVDVRGEGGYVILWSATGSRVINRVPIAPWPDWLFEAASNKGHRKLAAPATQSAARDSGGLWLAEGRWHNDVLSLVGRWVSEGVPDEVILARVPELTLPGWKEADTLKDVSRMLKYVREREAAKQPAARERPLLSVNAADLSAVAADLDKILAMSGAVFQRGGNLVRMSHLQADLRGGASMPMDSHAVVNAAHEFSIPMGFEAKGLEQPKTLPDRVAKLLIAMPHRWTVPELDGVTSAPLLTKGGGIRTASGYDAETKMWCADIPYLNVPEAPTRDQADAALRRVRRFMRTFCFADAATVLDPETGNAIVDLDRPPAFDESGALHGLLTAVVRPSLHLAPGLRIAAPALSGAATGKGKLARVIGQIAYGIDLVATPAPPDDPKEFDKQVGALLMQATQVCFLDNLNNVTLKSRMLASVLTERPAQVRVLGLSQMVSLSSATFFLVTGNAITMGEDLARRFLLVELDAMVENPEGRKFRSDVLEEARVNRGAILTDLLTIWRWGQQTSGLNEGVALGSFDTWGKWVRDPLVALGCADPVERILRAKLLDPTRSLEAELYQAWWAAHGSDPVTVHNLSAAVTSIADPQERGLRYLQSYFQKRENSRIAGFVLTRQGAAGKWGPATYSLKPTTNPPPPRSVPWQTFPPLGGNDSLSNFAANDRRPSTFTTPLTG